MKSQNLKNELIMHNTKRGQAISGGKKLACSLTYVNNMHAHKPLHVHAHMGGCGIRFRKEEEKD